MKVEKSLIVIEKIKLAKIRIKSINKKALRFRMH